MEKKYYRILVEFIYLTQNEDEAIESFFEDYQNTSVTETDWEIEEAPELDVLYRLNKE